ncbi:hypothetical protein Bbelb_074310 [Branchiostoma belcheri]|nr:hypothetical protein Bbelb_074310 [Branchiostoma belcheri]
MSPRSGEDTKMADRAVLMSSPNLGKRVILRSPSKLACVVFLHSCDHPQPYQTVQGDSYVYGQGNNGYSSEMSRETPCGHVGESAEIRLCHKLPEGDPAKMAESRARSALMMAKLKEVAESDKPFWMEGDRDGRKR